MALQLQPGDTWVVLGDSITAGVGQGTWYGPMVASVNASYTRAAVPAVSRAASATFSRATMTVGPAGAQANYSPVVTNKGHSGDTVADLQARVNADVIALAPTVVFVEAGVNDMVTGVQPSTFAAQCVTLANTIRAGLPTARLGWVGIFCYGESYPDASWGALINAANASIQTAIEGVGGTYFDVRTPQQAYEAAHNTPPPGALSGFLTNDIIHPNAGAGIPLYSAAVLGQCALNGTP